MTPFRDFPIARKTLVLGLAPTICALLLVSLAATIVTYYRARATTTEDLNADAALVAENVAAALAFNDERAATDIVHAFRVKRNVDTVCVFDARDRLFAGFSRTTPCPEDANRAKILMAGRMVHREDAAIGGRHVGSVILAGNLVRLTTWVQVQAYVLAGTLLVALSFAILLNRRLRRSIVEPIESLAATAERVSQQMDYRVHAQVMTKDEIGRLVVSFNAMLDRIEEQANTAARLLQREQEASRLKDQFLASISHELRTPLNAIVGWLQIIRTTSPSPEKLEHAFERIERNAHAQTRVVEDLIDISRIVSGKLQVRTSVVDMRSVLNSAIDVVRPAFTAKRVGLSVDELASDTLVAGDADRLQQVLWNLLSNAVKFTPAGGSVAATLDNHDAEVLVRIQDSGIGIDATFLPHVFERFRQADGSSTRVHGGLGLGLAIAKELTELHGGRLVASSAGAELGSVFVLSLPALLQSASAPVIQPFAPTATRLDGIHVLVVDDDPDNVAILGDALEQAGAQVVRAASGLEAIQRWTDSPCDVLVCDIAMPGIDGFAVWETIQQRTLDGRAPIGIAVTAYSSDELRKATAACGFREHVVKPYAPHTIINAIAAAYTQVQR